jgi:uncharacterized membrane protein
MEQVTPKDRLFAAISYIWILSLVSLFLVRENEYVQFHAKQGVILFIAWSLGWLVFWVPLAGQVFMLALLVASITGVYKAWKGERFVLPIVSKFAERINL